MDYNFELNEDSSEEDFEYDLEDVADFRDMGRKLIDSPKQVKEEPISSTGFNEMHFAAINR